MKTTFIPGITNSITERAIAIIENNKNDRSAWNRAVISAAIFMIDNIQQDIADDKVLGSTLYHSEQIDKYLLNDAGNFTASEKWVDVQARALFQARTRVKRAIKQAITELETEFGDNICY